MYTLIGIEIIYRLYLRYCIVSFIYLIKNDDNNLFNCQIILFKGDLMKQ